MTAQPIEPGEHEPEVLHIAPQIPGRPLPQGVVAVPVTEYERIRRRAIAQQIRERTERMRRGDFSDFQEVTPEEITSGRLDA